jgi:hypothetical protein
LLHNIPDSKNQQEQNFENDTILNWMLIVVNEWTVYAL